MSSLSNINPAAPTSLDSALRPVSWDEYVGQKQVKANVRISLDAAKKRGSMPEHILFYGPPGVGKTTLAHLVATTLGSPLKNTSGVAIERAGDLAAILTNLEPNTVLFIDEIHRLSRKIEELLYPALESVPRHRSWERSLSTHCRTHLTFLHTRRRNHARCATL